MSACAGGLVLGSQSDLQVPSGRRYLVQGLWDSSGPGSGATFFSCSCSSCVKQVPRLTSPTDRLLPLWRRLNYGAPNMEPQIADTRVRVPVSAPTGGLVRKTLRPGHPQHRRTRHVPPTPLALFYRDSPLKKHIVLTCTAMFVLERGATHCPLPAGYGNTASRVRTRRMRRTRSLSNPLIYSLL